jgi:enamine deaminase RidA (YjgF/YER057c/UK114 family)
MSENPAAAGRGELIRPPVSGVIDTTPLGFAPVVIARGGALVFTNSVGYDADWALTGDGGLAAQLRQSCRNLLLQLGAAGSGRADIVHVRINIVNLQPDDRLVVGEVFAQELYHPDPGLRPTTSLIGIAALARPELRVELEAIAQCQG